MTDHRIRVVRDALVKTHGLYVSDFEIRTLLAAIDKIGVPLPAAQTISLDELTQKPMGGDEFLLDLLADAQAHDESRGLGVEAAWPARRLL